ncbi:MAG: NAD(P)/FAD-dependent oxidoreductase [Salinibacterium sp.]|nr:MAG: NAD(P)/FAD-dependent oxidoreductase [Salinibacterium sp.]
MSPDVDIVIAGGGPVGLSAAIQARLAGLTAAVIEPRDGVIDKACGEGLMPGAIPLLATLGVDPEGMPLRGVSYRSRRHRADHLFQGGPGRGVRRTTLHRALLNRAKELGVHQIEGRVTEFEQDATGVTVNGMRAGWLLACDGLHSTVRRVAGLERPQPRSGRRFGLRQHFLMEPWTDLIEIHWTPHAEVYITPLAPSLIGIATLGVAHTDFGATIAGIPGLARRLDGVEPADTVRGAGPFHQRTSRRQIGRVLLVGDASGYVDAITGEGLRLGLEQAGLAIRSIVDGVHYERAWLRSTRDFRVLTTGLVRLATSPLRGAIVPAARFMPGRYGAIVERLAQ